MGSSVNKIQKPTYTKQEVAKHIKRESLWITANGRVYDITAFLSSHPGGDKIFLKKAGQNCSTDYLFHSKNAKKMWQKYWIGNLE